MIKKFIIRILTVFILLAFIAVVSVQWIWIKYSMREAEARFTSIVYDVLGKAVDLVDDVNTVNAFNATMEEFDASVTNTITMIWEENPYTGIEMIFQESRSTRNDVFQFVRENMDPRYNRADTKEFNRRFMQQALIDKDSIINSMVDSITGDIIRSNLNNFLVRAIQQINPTNRTIAERLANVDFYAFMSEELPKRGVDNKFKIEVLNRNQILEKTRNKDIKYFYYTELFPKDIILTDANLCITFTDNDSLFYDNIGWMFFASGFCILGLMAVLTITLFIIMRQQKLSLIKNDFINNMTHEFKTPLATISLATSAIEKEKVQKDKSQLLKFNSLIKSENDRMNKYVERILLQAKLDRREIHLKKENINLNVLVMEAIDHFRLQIEERGGKITEHLDDEGYVMSLDEVHMLNVIFNLIDNAIKYSPETVNINVFTRREGNRFIIAVKDEGIGIPKEAQNKVFKRFYRVPSGNIHNVKGFGLGLSYVKSIVMLHGGDIRLTSKKGKGTLMEIIFPMDSL